MVYKNNPIFWLLFLLFSVFGRTLLEQDLVKLKRKYFAVKKSFRNLNWNFEGTANPTEVLASIAADAASRTLASASSTAHGSGAAQLPISGQTSGLEGGISSAERSVPRRHQIEDANSWTRSELIFLADNSRHGQKVFHNVILQS